MADVASAVDGLGSPGRLIHPRRTKHVATKTRRQVKPKGACKRLGHKSYLSTTGLDTVIAVYEPDQNPKDEPTSLNELSYPERRRSLDDDSLNDKSQSEPLSPERMVPPWTYGHS
ncbi:unnamed protein product [Phytophthora fragariaefolia]|uniref:Unnamed protein product n=1 Tax=Phytophthora fragariaefolia TaxID=1490495 RepID=A0A9W6XZ50_9STRA|nr:unnamed protein product [Phytophthora fragariaefolia]